jgi:ABC-2 type transport system permease protein
VSDVALARDSGSIGSLDVVRRWIDASVGIVKRDAAIRLTYRGSFISENVSVVFTLAVFYFISKLVHVTPFTTPSAYFAFAVVGIVIFGIVRSSLTIPTGLRQELVAGTYERLVLSPFGGTSATVSLVIFPVLYSLAIAFLQLAVAVALFGLHLQWSTAALALPLGIAGALAFAPFALVFAAVTLAFKQAPGQGAALAVISLASGMYFPVALLPWWLRWISDVQPFTPTVDLLRHVLLGMSMHGSTVVALVKIGAFIAVGIPVGVRLIAVAGWYGRRRGTVIEY